MPKLIVASLLACFFSTGAHSEQAQIGTPREQVTTSDSVHATVTSLSGDIAAGEVFEFTVTLDRAPNFKGDVGYISVGPNNSQIGTGCAERRDAPEGSGLRLYGPSCRNSRRGHMDRDTTFILLRATHRSNRRFKPISFRVRPRTDLIFPKASAEVVGQPRSKAVVEYAKPGRLPGAHPAIEGEQFRNIQIEKKPGAVAACWCVES